jgi:hypothetical protein
MRRGRGDDVGEPFGVARLSLFGHRAHFREGAVSLEAESFVKDRPPDAMPRERAHGRQRVGHLADRGRPRAFHFTCGPLDGLDVVLGSFRGAQPHHALDPRHEPVPTRDLPAQRRKLEVRVRIHEPRQKDARHPLDGEPGVRRQNRGRRPDVEDRSVVVEHQRRVAERRLFSRNDGVGVDDAGRHAGSVNQS